MRKRELAQRIATAMRCKDQLIKDIAKRQKMVSATDGLEQSHNSCCPELSGWYQLRKYAARQLKNLSAGKLILLESGYRGNHRRHTMKALGCGHVFRSSLRELATGGYGKYGTRQFAHNACPFCSPPRDLRRCGSVAAVQEFVWQRSYGKTTFADSNVLGSCESDYTFGCEIHRLLFEASFTKFLEDGEGVDFCPQCAFEHGPQR